MSIHGMATQLGQIYKKGPETKLFVVDLVAKFKLKIVKLTLFWTKLRVY